MKWGETVKRLICLSIMICMVTGCAQKTRQGTADNEVITLKEVPEDKIMITVRMGDGANFESMESAIETEFPEVDIVIRSNTSVDQAIAYRDTEDIMMMVDGNYLMSDLADCFIDLSSESYVQNYYLSTLMESELDGKLYYLPGPCNIYGIVYNKDMFREHGWKVPQNLDEFIELCNEIEKAGIRPIQPALYYKDAVRQLFTGFTYQQILSGGENEKWISDYRRGNAVMEGHLEPAFDIMDRLLEAGVFCAEDFEVQPRTRSEMMYESKTCAMIFETQAAVDYAENRAGEDAPDIGLLPFFSGSNEDSDYFLAVPIYNIAISKRLEEKGNEEKLVMAKRILEYLSTAEGQTSAMGDNTSVISSVRGVEYAYNDFLEEAKSTIEKGHVVPQPFFVETANSGVDQVLREDLCLYAEGKIDRKRFMQELDQARDLVLANQKATETVTIGTAEETFTVLQTACLLGEVFQERTGTQIGLCMANTRYAGNNWKIYKGDIQYGRDSTLDSFWTIAFQHAEDSNKIEGKLVKVKMTGENIIKALNTPYLQHDNFQNAYFTASGLQITFAPWAEAGSRYVSVKLADGTELSPEERYTVAFWNGAVDPELIESVEETYDDEVADLFQQWVKDQGGSIKPDNRDFVLDWTTNK